jgi:pyruvate/2-oxoglutarate dehydrogenase complex dihydrolipoamide dehydrogenase (E3) component
VVGGGRTGLEVAEWLAGQGRVVTVVELLAEVARDMDPINRAMTLKRLQSQPVEVLTDTEVVRVGGGVDVVVRDASSGEDRPLGTFDSVVVSVGQEPYDPLSRELEAAGVPLVVVGDASAPGEVLDATRTAYEAMRVI